jgi:hypothetical protein
MLAGVLFDYEITETGKHVIVPKFINKYVLTDVILSSSSTSPTPVLPSIATLLAPVTKLPTLLYSILRAVTLTAASHLNQQLSIRRISVANTALLYHDGRALATCESGPPMWISLPGLETIGWWDLEGDYRDEIGLRENGGTILGWMKEWCTAHVRTLLHSAPVDFLTNLSDATA